MKITKVKFADAVESGFDLDEIECRPHINLFVGLSGSGKTRVLNFLMNIGTAVARGNRYLAGRWEMHFEHNSQAYVWEYDGQTKASSSQHLLEETLYSVNEETDQLEEIFVRKNVEVTFLGQTLPKLGNESMGIFMFREEDDVRDAYAGFCRLQRRIFAGDDLSNAVQIQGYPYALLERLQKLGRRRTIENLWTEPLSLHVRLFVLEKFFPKSFRDIERSFIEVFPNLLGISVGAAAKHLNGAGAVDAPVALLRERGVPKPTQIGDIASGMLKVLLILTDVIASPDGIVYMIDEYENSLGVNAINFLPTFLLEHGGERQFFVTSHHPFLINAIPIEDWFVFKREGLRIHIVPGSRLREKYGRSKQQHFIQLMNDPIYTESQ